MYMCVFSYLFGLGLSFYSFLRIIYVYYIYCLFYFDIFSHLVEKMKIRNSKLHKKRIPNQSKNLK